MKQLYQHRATKQDRQVELQTKNLADLIGVAVEQGLGSLSAIVHPDVPVMLPHGAKMQRTEKMPGEAVSLDITFPKRRKPRSRQQAKA